MKRKTYRSRDAEQPSTPGGGGGCVPVFASLSWRANHAGLRVTVISAVCEHRAVRSTVWRHLHERRYENNWPWSRKSWCIQVVDVNDLSTICSEVPLWHYSKPRWMSALPRSAAPIRECMCTWGESAVRRIIPRSLKLKGLIASPFPRS